MKHLFVPYALALLLKEKGFDQPCMAYYTPAKQWMKDNPAWAKELENGFLLKTVTDPFGDNFRRSNQYIKNSDFTKAVHNITVPLYQQVVDWLYYPHGIVIGYAYETDLWTVAKDRKLLYENGALDRAIEEALKFIP